MKDLRMSWDNVAGFHLDDILNEQPKETKPEGKVKQPSNIVVYQGLEWELKSPRDRIGRCRTKYKFQDSEARLKSQGFVRHPRVAEIIKLISDYEAGTLTDIQKKLYQDMFKGYTGEWIDNRVKYDSYHHQVHFSFGVGRLESWKLDLDFPEFNQFGAIKIPVKYIRQIEKFYGIPVDKLPNAVKRSTLTVSSTEEWTPLCFGSAMENNRYNISFQTAVGCGSRGVREIKGGAR